jgi:hypothetical protein
MGELVAPVIGGAFQYAGAKRQAASAETAARTAADAQLGAARIAAEEARFRPIGVTTRFGSSQFGYGPDGRVESAGYTVDPELRAYQDRLMAAAGQGLGSVEGAPGAYGPLTGGAQRLFDLGSQYVGQSPEDVAARYIQQQQNLLAPSRERQFSQLQNQLFNTGRGGLAVGATGMRPGGGMGLGAANPEMEAYYNALAQQDATLAAQGMQEGQRQTAFGAGLFGTGAGLLGSYNQGLVGSYAPFLTGLGAAGQVEQLGMEPLTLGAALGGRIANPTGASALLQGGMGAARSIQSGTGFSPMGGLLSGFGQQVGGMNFGSGTLGQYASSIAPIAQYGASNVYGGFGQGQVPTEINWTGEGQ